VRLAAVVLLAAACGRVGFDGVGDGGAVGGDGAGGDGTGIDSPSTSATCGDQVCEGTSNETCKSCTMDCRTTANVCGNGACGPGEDGTSCFIDCGPVPWTWDAEEVDLLGRINAARTGGTSCGGGGPTTAGALTIDTELQAAARDLAWEQARYGLALSRCNGQSILTYYSSVNVNGSKQATSSTSTTNAQRMADWIADGNGCPTLMMASFTRIGIAIAVEQNNGYVALFR
jgi:hypothetical protein